VSEQREIINLTTGQPVSLTQALDREPENIKELRAQKKARLIRVLDRGVIIDRLHVDLPAHLHGEWFPKDTLAVHEANVLGFHVDTEYATKMPMFDNKDPDGGAVVGDVIFMVCEKETKELIDEIRTENFERVHGKHGRGQREERDFATSTRAVGLPVVDESSSRTARKQELQEALQKAHGSDKPDSHTIIK